MSSAAADLRASPAGASPWRRSGAAWWIVWAALALVGAAGLPQLHVNNSLAAWAPRQESSEGLATYLVVGFEASAVDAGHLEQTLRRLPSVAWCFGPASEAVLRIAGVSPQRLVVGDDGRYAGIYCFARPGVRPDRLWQEVGRVLDNESRGAPAMFAMSGSAAYAAALNEVSQRRMPLIISLITFAGAAMLWWLTGSARAAASGLAAIGASMIILLGGIAWCGVDVDMSLLLVPPLMISLGYSYAAHAALRRDAAPALAVCGVTSVLGVAAFGVTDLPSIRTFALDGSIGIVLVWTCVVSLIPRPAAPRPRDALDRAAMAALLEVLRHSSPAIVVLAVVVCAAGLWLGPSLAVDAQPLRYFASTERIVRDTRVLESRLTGTLPFEVVAPPGVHAESILQREAIIRKVAAIPLPAGRARRIAWCLADSDALDALQDLFARWRRGQPEVAAGFRIGGAAPQLLEVRHQMRRVAAVSIPCMLGVAGVAAGLLSRSAAAVLAGVLVNLVPVAAVVAIGVSFSWTCQMPTLMVGAIGIGAGIDDAIHVLWLRRRHSLARSLRICVRACAGSSLVAAVCMAAFSLSPFRPTAQFGLLMALVLIIAAFADMIVLPALLRVASHTRRRAPAAE